MSLEVAGWISSCSVLNQTIKGSNVGMRGGPSLLFRRGVPGAPVLLALILIYP